MEKGNFRVVITGSSGMLGRAVYNKFCADQDYITSGFVYSRNRDPSRVKCDLTVASDVVSKLNTIKPHLIIHCAAERRPDVVSSNPTQAFGLNVGSTETLSKWAKENSACVLYISSDYVFDGKNPPYSEADAPNPLNDYGKMKLQSEKIVMGFSQGNIIVRLPILYGDVEYVEESAVTILFNKVKDNTTACLMSNHEKRYPTHCEDVAETIYKMVNYRFKGQRELDGIFHYQSDEEMTKFEMALEMAYLFGVRNDHIAPEELPTGNEATQRPYKAQMRCDRLRSLDLYHKPRTFAVGIRSSLTKLKFYP